MTEQKEDDETIIESGEIRYEDLEYHVEYSVKKYYIEFVVRRIAPTTNENGDKKDYWQGEMGPTRDREESELDLTGDLKWDGCSNWDFQTDECRKHFCRPKQMLELGVLLTRLYDLGDKMPTWIGGHKRG